MTTPTGDPPWARTADSETYGGVVGKHDFQNQGVTNPLTDVSAAQYLRLTNDVAAMAGAAPFATIKVTCNDTGTAAPTINWIFAMNGNQPSGYAGGAAPTGFPVGTRNGDGSITLTWPTSISDSYAVASAPAIIGATGRVNAGAVSFTLVDSRTVTFAALSGATPIANAVMTLKVY
jgi:hypothetical protein